MKQQTVEVQFEGESEVQVVRVKPTRLRVTAADVTQDGKSLAADLHITLALKGQRDLDVSYVRKQRDFAQKVYRGVGPLNYTQPEIRQLVKARTAAFLAREVRQ